MKDEICSREEDVLCRFGQRLHQMVYLPLRLRSHQNRSTFVATDEFVLAGSTLCHINKKYILQTGGEVGLPQQATSRKGEGDASLAR